MTLPESREALLALAERCEKATGPDRELDDVITAALGNGLVPGHPPIPYTASLDAAMTLVPEGADYAAGKEGAAVRVTIWRDPTNETIERGEAKTPALALCAAALKGRAQTPSGGEGE